MLGVGRQGGVERHVRGTDAFPPPVRPQPVLGIAVDGGLIGKYIYAADACDDYENDKKTGSYNPLLYGEGDIKAKLCSAFGAMCIWADRAAGELTLEGSTGHSFDTADNIMRLGMVDTAKELTVSASKGRKDKKHGKRPL